MLFRSEELQQIIDLLIRDLSQRIVDNGYQLQLTESAREVILKEGYEPAYGARPLKRAIQRLVEDPMSEEILKKTVKLGDTILVDAEDGKIIIKKL